MVNWQASLLFVLVLLGVTPLSLAEEEATADKVRKMLLPNMGAAIAKGETEKTDKVERELAVLGRTLFYDKRLSPNNTHSCNSCHDLSRYGTGGDYYLELKKQNKVFRDVPGIYNLKHLTVFGWASSNKDLANKITESLSSVHEMNITSLDEQTKRLNEMPGYRGLFREAFPKERDLVTVGNISLALKTFIEGLITPAPIDAFLSGDNQALTEKQLKGALAFSNNNCFACHTGPLIGGQLIMKLGVPEEWPNQADKGYFEISKDPAHVMAFRVSALRNVEKTAPYFHDFSSKRLWDAIGKMARYELGKQLSLEEIDHIQEFLKSLTGVIPVDDIKAPDMPN